MRRGRRCSTSGTCLVISSCTSPTWRAQGTARHLEGEQGDGAERLQQQHKRRRRLVAASVRLSEPLRTALRGAPPLPSASWRGAGAGGARTWRGAATARGAPFTPLLAPTTTRGHALRQADAGVGTASEPPPHALGVRPARAATFDALATAAASMCVRARDHLFTASGMRRCCVSSVPVACAATGDTARCPRAAHACKAAQQ